MRIRTVKPGFWKSETLAGIAKEHRLLAVALLNYADDEGYFLANEALIRGECFPFDEDSESITVGLRELSRISYIVLGTTIEGQKIGRVLNFLEHQSINKPLSSKLKTKSITWIDVREDSGSSPVGLHHGSGSGSGSGRSITPSLNPTPLPLTPKNPEHGNLKQRAKTRLPETFGISDRVRDWAKRQGFDRLEDHLDTFRLKCAAKGYAYTDWDAAFMAAIRDDWAGIAKERAGNGDALSAGNKAVIQEFLSSKGLSK